MDSIKILGIQTHYLGTDGKERLSAVDWWRIVNPLIHIAKNCPDVEVDFVTKIIRDDQKPDDVWMNIGE